MKKLTGILLLSLILFPGIAPAGPPFFTDDPEPVGYQHWEIYAASTYVRETNGSSGTCPHSEINYGLLPNVQAHLIIPVAYSHPKEEPSHYGYGDTELGFKYRFLQETDHLPQIGVFPIIEISTGDEKKGLGNGKAQTFIPIWFQKSRGSWTTYGGGGYWVNPGEGNRDWVFTGWELQREFSKNLTLGAEIFHRTADKDDEKKQHGI